MLTKTVDHNVTVWRLQVVQCSSDKPGIFRGPMCTECIMQHNLYSMWAKNEREIKLKRGEGKKEKGRGGKGR